MTLPADFVPSLHCDCAMCLEFLSLHPGYWQSQGVPPEQQPGQWQTVTPNVGAGGVSPTGASPFFSSQIFSANPQPQVTTTAGSLVFDEVAPTPKPKKAVPLKTNEVGGIPIKNRVIWYAELYGSPILYLIRGVPGSSKSSLALMIQKGIRALGPVMIPVMSVDDYFIKADANGNESYFFDPEKLPEAHANCQEQCKKIMQQEQKIPIIIANSFLSRQHMLPYQRMAREHGYQVLEIVCKGTFENIHGVPPDKVRRMKQGFEN